MEFSCQYIVKNSCCYSETIYGLAQGSILGPLLFNIYNCAIFFDINECDSASYADNNTPYNFDFSLENSTSNLEKSTKYLLNWFGEHHVEANDDNCRLLVSSDESCTAKIEEFIVLKTVLTKNCNLRLTGYMT